jgi:hypothetical protein
MKFINKNAYIQTAIFSTGFCKSAKAAFWLIARNLARVGAVSVITEFVMIAMKLLISLGTASLAYLGMQSQASVNIWDYYYRDTVHADQCFRSFPPLQIEDELYSIVGPTVFVAVLAFFIASIFADLYSMTTSTILQVRFEVQGLARIANSMNASDKYLLFSTVLHCG